MPVDGLTVEQVRVGLDGMKKGGCWACGSLSEGWGRVEYRIKVDWVKRPDRCARDVGTGWACEIVVDEVKGRDLTIAAAPS